MSFLLTIPHCNISAAAPVAIAVATLVPSIVPVPPGYIPDTPTPGAVKSGAAIGRRVGPHEEKAYILLSIGLYAPIAIGPIAVDGMVTV